MKKISILIALFASIQGYAQTSIENLRIATPLPKGAIQYQVPSSERTSASDTVRFQSHLFRCVDSLASYPYSSQVGGYLAGTMGAIKTTTGAELLITEQGLTLQMRGRREKEMHILGAFIWWGPGTKVVGSADTFRVNVYRTFSSTLPTQGNDQPNFSQAFSGDNFIDWNPGKVAWDDEGSNYIPFDTNVGLSGDNVVLAVETKTKTSDDSLTFFFAASNKTCDPGDTNTWVARLRETNFKHVAWYDYMQFLQAPFDVPCFVPVVEYSPVSSDEDFIQSGSLQLFGNYPNPAVDHTRLSFKLEKPASVTIKVLDMQGRLISKTEAMEYTSGKHEYLLDTQSLACGSYLCILQTSHGSLGTRIHVEK